MMIEIVYNETKAESAAEKSDFSIPNNIRQIGECSGKTKIYLEDYAYTYLKRLGNLTAETGCMAILLGDIEREGAISYVFIRSILGVDSNEIAAEHIELKEMQWSQIHQGMEQYFSGQEIVGWCLIIPGFDMKITDVMLQTHLNHFAGEQKVFFAMEPLEQEEAFFVFESGKLKKQTGYYIFYEKNEPMQSYMIEQCGNVSIENDKNVSDRAVGDFRKLITGKQEHAKKERQMQFSFVKVAAVATILLLGITWMNHQKTMEEISEETVQNDVYQEKITPTTEVITVTPTTMPTEEIPSVTPKPDLDEKEVVEKESESKEEQEETLVDTYQKYIVKKGDTLTKISETYYGGIQKVREICKINNLESEDLIYTGQMILLP